MHRSLNYLFLLTSFVFVACSPAFAQEQSQSEIEALKGQIEALKTEYGRRIEELEAELEKLQIQVLAIPEPAPVEAQPAEKAQTFPGILNPAISVIGNFLSRGDSERVFNEEGDRIDNKMNLRETELDFRVAVDPFADAVLIAAFESEFPGEFEAAIEEGYVTIKSLPFFERMPLGAKLKVGRFRPLFGRMNILHTHDLPTSLRPLPVEEFLGEEGFVQNGVSTNFFLPMPWDEAGSLDLTLEIIDGGDIGVSPSPDARTAYLGHLRYFRNVAAVHDFEIGYSTYFHPSGNELEQAQLHGVDFMYRWKPLRRGQWKSYILGAEVMFAPDINRIEEEEESIFDDGSGGGTPVGFTAFNQWQFNRRLYAGLRFDYTETVVTSDITRRSITPYISYYFSEFLRFRVNYERRWSDVAEEDGRNSIFLELNWIFGSHPPEPFWVNK